MVDLVSITETDRLLDLTAAEYIVYIALDICCSFAEQEQTGKLCWGRFMITCNHAAQY
jgi:hypothetical protein